MLDDEESGINLEDYSGPLAEWVMSPAVSRALERKTPGGRRGIEDSAGVECT